MYISVVLPAKNESGAIGDTIKKIQALDLVSEILVINDGSTDDTCQVADIAQGYLTVVVGARQKGSQASIGRGIANALYNNLASYMSDHKVEDLTSGFRAESNMLMVILPVIGLYGVAAYRILPAAQNIYRAVTTYKFSEHILSSVIQEFELCKIENTQKVNEENIDFAHKIELIDVSFAYPNQPKIKVLEHINIKIEKNTSLGITGKSGSGKSTLMDIMLGLLQPTSGTLRVDEKIITDVNVKSWQSLVSYVPQFIYLADMTVAENIAFGIPKDKIDFKLVEDVAKLAQIHEFITQKLKDGYSTMIGERGILLSGGQRQRLGIARAL
ncbi:hypothetical protein FQR65_LT18161 [Abscondita terminalis]|nr:hypothetical protein FQR65_LT18161 [Abscondita terminalis]